MDMDLIILVRNDKEKIAEFKMHFRDLNGCLEAMDAAMREAKEYLDGRSNSFTQYEVDQIRTWS